MQVVRVEGKICGRPGPGGTGALEKWMMLEGEFLRIDVGKWPSVGGRYHPKLGSNELGVVRG